MTVYQLQLDGDIRCTPRSIILNVGKTFNNPEDAAVERIKLNTELYEYFDIKVDFNENGYPSDVMEEAIEDRSDGDITYRNFDLDSIPSWSIDEIKIED
jgi:hypothetical protein